MDLCPKNIDTTGNLEKFWHGVLEPALNTEIFVVLQKVSDDRKNWFRNRRSDLIKGEGMAISHMIWRVNGPYPTLEAFNGIVIIRLFKYLAATADNFNAVGSPEATELRPVTYYLDEE